MSETAKKAASAPKRSAAQIEADIDSTRTRLVGTIAELEDRVKPANVAKKGKARLQEVYQGPNGVRWDRVGMTVGGAVGAVLAIRATSVTLRWMFALPRRRTQTVYVPFAAPQLTLPSE